MWYDASLWMDKLCVHSRLRECKCRPNSTAQKKNTRRCNYDTLHSKKCALTFQWRRWCWWRWKKKKKRERKCLDFLCILYKFYFMREIESFLIVVLVINQKPLFRFVMTFSLSFCAITWTNVRKSNEWDPICVKFQASHSPI